MKKLFFIYLISLLVMFGCKPDQNMIVSYEYQVPDYIGDGLETS